MIYKLSFDDKTEHAQAKNILHLLQSYEKEYGDFQDIKSVEEVSEEEAKGIMIKNLDFDENDPEDAAEFSLFDMVVGDDFCIVSSTDY